MQRNRTRNLTKAEASEGTNTAGSATMPIEEVDQNRGKGKAKKAGENIKTG